MINKEKIKYLIKKFQLKYPDYSKLVEWNNTLMIKWEYEMLIAINVINPNSILYKYPVLKIYFNNGKEKTEDFGGNIDIILEKAKEINKSTSKAKAILSYIQIYSTYKKFKNEIYEESN